MLNDYDASRYDGKAEFLIASAAGTPLRGALAARGGIRLRAGQPGDGCLAGGRARRDRPPGRLDHRDLERRHGARPGGGGNLLAAEALPDPPPAPPPNEAPGPPGAGTRNGMPLYDFAQKRIVHHLIAETPVRTSSLRGLGATVNVFAIEFL